MLFIKIILVNLEYFGLELGEFSSKQALGDAVVGHRASTRAVGLGARLGTVPESYR